MNREMKALRSAGGWAFVVALLAIACKSSDPNPNSSLATSPSPASVEDLKFKTGRNDYKIKVDSIERDFIVYVPSAYSESKPTPLVLMFHGTNGSGRGTFNDSGWKEKAEKEGFLTVFPSSLRYFIVEENQNQTKWSSTALPGLVKPGTEVKDDVRFVREMLRLIQATWNADAKRIYASGFSNGGAFVSSRLMVEMPEVFAAFGSSAGLLHEPLQPRNGEVGSLYQIVGTEDNKLLERGAGGGRRLPIEAPQILQDDILGNSIRSVLATLNLDAAYEVEYERPDFSTMTFDRSLSGAGNEFKFRMVSGMRHIWPTGENHRSGLSAPDLFWEFFLLHPKK